jgi:predicted dinucleotide-binding enzyme
VQEEPELPDVAVIGAGAVGTVAASAAEQAGLEVVICARSPVSPVVLELDGQERRVVAPVLCDPDQAPPADWVLLATKAQQTPQAGPWLARLCRPGTVVVVLASCCPPAGPTGSSGGRSSLGQCRAGTLAEVTVDAKASRVQPLPGA